MKTMSLWRLEWLRSVRTKRWLALVGVYLFFGLTAAPLTRYLAQLMERVSEVRISGPPTTAVDGFSSYSGNANQLGLLVFAFIVADAVALDARREMSVFLRTRVDRYRTLLVPKFTVPVTVGVVAYLLGVGACWYGSVLLLGSVDAAGVLVGGALGALYLVFIGAVAAAFGSCLRSVVSTAVATLGVALGLGILGTIGWLGAWLPSKLLGALTTLAAGGSLDGLVKPTLVTLLATAVLLVFAAWMGDRREL